MKEQYFWCIDWVLEAGWNVGDRGISLRRDEVVETRGWFADIAKAWPSVAGRCL